MAVRTPGGVDETFYPLPPSPSFSPEQKAPSQQFTKHGKHDRKARLARNNLNALDKQARDLSRMVAKGNCQSSPSGQSPGGEPATDDDPSLDKRPSLDGVAGSDHRE